MYTYEFETVVLTWEEVRDDRGDTDHILRAVDVQTMTVTSIFDSFYLFDLPDDLRDGDDRVYYDAFGARYVLDGELLNTSWPIFEGVSFLAAARDGRDFIEVLSTEIPGDGAISTELVVGLAGVDITDYASFAGVEELFGWDDAAPTTQIGPRGTAIDYADLPNLLSQSARFVDGVSDRDDVLKGTAAAETADMGRGDDAVVLRGGDDAAFGGRGDDTLNGGRGDDFLVGGQGADVLVGGGGDDYVDGQGGRDRLLGSGGRDKLVGGGGADDLKGGGGSDTLEGDRGNDTINGGGGADLIIGGRGDDVLTGGGGADLFVFDSRRGTDTITDFRDGTDLLEVGLGGFDAVEVADHEDGTLITFGRQQIILEGVASDRIDASDFLTF